MPLPSFITPIADMSAAAPTLWVLIKATLILLAGLTIALAMHRSSASTRYVVWLLSLVGLLALPAIAKLSPFDVPILPAAAPAPLHSNTAQPNAPVSGNASNGTSIANTPAGTERALDVPSGGSITPTRTIPLTTLLLGLWAAVAAVLLARLLLGVVAVRRIVRRAQPLASPQWQELLFEIADRLGLEQAPALLKTSDISMPFAAGVRKAIIVLPAECEEWSPAQRDAVLIHELGHVRRRDMIGHTLGRVACAVYWFHPLVWTAARKLRDASERACDDLAIRLGARPSEYAQHLLDIVTSVRQTNTPTAAIAMARRKEFEGRMLAILDPALRRESASRWRTAALSSTLALFVFAVSAAAPAQRATAATTASAPSGESAPNPGTGSPLLDPQPMSEPTAVRDAAEAQEGQLPVANEAARQAAPIIDRFLRDQARRINVNVNTVLAGEAADPEKRDLLIRILRTDSAASVRRVAAWGLLPYVTDANAQAALLNALQGDADPAVRKMSAWALAHSPAPAALGALRTAFSNDRDEEVREMAVWGIGTHGDASDEALISGRLGSESSSDVRGTAAWALGNVGAKSAPRALIAMLDDTDESARLRAAWALSQIGDSTALPAIQRALSAPQDQGTTRALLRALVQSGASPEMLTGLLNSPYPDVRTTAIRSMTGGGLVDPWPWPWPRPIVWP